MNAITTLLLASLLVTNAAPAAQIIDRILAVVAEQPITLSDVNAAVKFGFVSVPETPGDKTDAVLNGLIERQLQLIEVGRYGPAEPATADLDARVAAVRARFQSAAAYEATLAETGLTENEIRARVRDDLRIESYLQQRFGAVYQASEDEMTRYYRTHEADFTRAGVLRPFADVRAEVQRRMSEERTATIVREWISGLRRRADVTILPKS